MAKVIKLSNKYSANMTREEADAEVARLVAKGREILAAKAKEQAKVDRLIEADQERAREADRLVRRESSE